MPDNDAEKKKIADLYFNVDTDNLKDINRILESIDSKAEEISKKNLNIKIDTSKLIDVNGLQSQYTKMENLSQKSLNRLEENRRKQIDNSSAYAIKQASKEVSTINVLKQQDINNANKNQRRITEITEKGHQDRLTLAQRYQQKIAAENEKQLKSTESLYDKISKYAKTYLIYQGFNTMRTAATELINEMVEVQYQMTSIDRVLNDSSLNINEYRDQLIQLAYDYGNSFDSVADATLKLAQAGFSAEESLQLTEKTLLALNTAELNSTQATDDMVAIMAQWGVTSADTATKTQFYGDTIDKINKVADEFPTSSADILDALKRTSSAFNLAGASIDETIAMITTAEVASQRGGKAIGTAMSNIIQQLKAEGRINIMEELGIDVYTDETKEEFNSVIDIIEQLSEKMQELKDSGKENSAEMQSLLEVFTVFRRNIGAGLLSGVAGEDSTYAQVLETSINAIGYSAEENAKHMQTAKAAQAQFNAELLKLKTEVWDGGLEDVFRGMLELGTDVVNGIRWLIDTFGLIPTAIGAATLAFTTFNKQLNIANAITVTGVDGVKKTTIQYSDWIQKIRNVWQELKTQNSYIVKNNDGTVKLRTSVTGMTKGLAKYSINLNSTTLKTIGLEAATIALNAALSLGLSAAITAVISLFDKLINADDKYLENINENLDKTREQIDTLEQEKESLDSLISEYEELSEKSNRTPEENEKIYELQLKINQVLSEQNESIDFNNLSYDEQLKKLKEITKEQLEQLKNEKKKQLELAQQGKIGTSLNAWESTWGGLAGDIEKELEASGIDLEREKALQLGEGFKNINFGNFFNDLNFEEQLGYLTEWEEALREAGKTGTDAYDWVSESLNTVKEQQESLTDATKEYYDIVAEQTVEELFPEDSIGNVEQYQRVLESLTDMPIDEKFQGFKNTLISLFKEQFPEFQTELEALEGNFGAVSDAISENIKSLTELSNNYVTLKTAQEEYNTTGTFTADTFAQLIADGGQLLQYLSFENGQLQINTQAMLNQAEATKVAAIQKLQAAAASDIEKVALGDVKNISNIAKGAIADVGNNAATMGNKAVTSAGQLAIMNDQLTTIINTSNGKLGEGVDPAVFQQQANAIKDAYMSIAKSISNIKITSPTYNPQLAPSVSSSGSSSAAKNAAERAAKEAKQAEEDAYKERLQNYKDYISDLEEEEERWVDKQEELGQLSSEDMQYVTQQRIKRYQQYLAQVKKMTWLNKEDRLELEKEYTQQIEDLQLDYLGYLKDALDEEIEALQDANDEKIKLIEEEADARIAALEKEQDANDRIRDEEDYQAQRQEILEEISYWEQRTGREAQEALKEAKKNLEELDEEWQDQLEDWSIEDQIEAIEQQRDEQIAAIEEAEAQEIESLQKIYDEKVKLFSETGKIIYDNSVIQSKKLYEAYKKNFVDPISSELSKLFNQTSSKKTSSSSKKEYETYKIKYGDTLSGIAAKFGTTVSKIMSANPSIKNKNLIYAGNTLKIPKFHEGGIVGGPYKESLALLKKGEVILKPEWADGINKLAKLVKNNTTNNNIINSGTTVEVKGDLVRVEANIKNKGDIDFLTRKIERVLTDKFNIKK